MTGIARRLIPKKTVVISGTDKRPENNQVKKRGTVWRDRGMLCARVKSRQWCCWIQEKRRHGVNIDEKRKRRRVHTVPLAGRGQEQLVTVDDIRGASWKGGLRHYGTTAGNGSESVAILSLQWASLCLLVTVPFSSVAFSPKYFNVFEYLCICASQ